MELNLAKHTTYHGKQTEQQQTITFIPRIHLDILKQQNKRNLTEKSQQTSRKKTNCYDTCQVIKTSLENQKASFYEDKVCLLINAFKSLLRLK